MKLALMWTLTVDPLTTALGVGHVQIERVLSSSTSLYVGPSVRFEAPWAKDPEPYRAYGVEAGLRWFPRAEAPRGPWVMARGVGARMSTTDASADPEPGGYASVLAGGTLIKGRIVLSGGAGVSYFRYDIGDYGITGFLPALHTNIGVAF